MQKRTRERERERNPALIQSRDVLVRCQKKGPLLHKHLINRIKARVSLLPPDLPERACSLGNS